MISLRRAAFAAALAFGAATADAQMYFGQNQVQYDRFKWRVLETEHFLIHYYPEERTAVLDAARMVERSYARLTRVLDHQFREKKAVVLYASRTDFGQNNVLGDLGEGTAGATEALRHRMLLPFTGDYRSFEHVLAHELVHAFQYDIYARGRAGAGLQEMARAPLPLWAAEGMAEYLSLGPGHNWSHTVMRDAALNGRLPSIEDMTLRPDRFFPYRFGYALWEYVAGRWGDEVIGEILNAIPNVGIERAFKQELGMSLEDLGDEWKDAMQTTHLPQVSSLQRPRRFAQPLLTERRTGGELFIAPALSDDGSKVAFLSTGDWKRGQVFIDLWLGDARTGKRIKRLVKSTFNPDFEELRLLYSQSAFSPDAKWLAFTGQRKGKDVLYILDVDRQKRLRRLDLPLEAAWNPTWSPDGTQLAFSGNRGGITDLYLVNADGSGLRQLTNDRYGDLQPQWSPDGKTIAFASERGEQADLATLRTGPWRIALYDLASSAITMVPGQQGHSINPVWAPDGRSLAYVSDRSRIANVFLFDLESRQHYQLTHVIGAVSSFTEYSPTITWAKRADKLAFTYFEDDEYTVWAVDNPRSLKREPVRDSAVVPTLVATAAPDSAAPAAVAPPGLAAAAAAAGAAGAAGARIAEFEARPAPDTVRRKSLYRSSGGFRASADLPRPGTPGTPAVVSVAALLDSAELALPETTAFKDRGYRVRFQPDYVVRPSIGYAQDNFGRGVYGGTTIILSDMLGNHRLALSGEINGRVSEARVFAAYANASRRVQYTTGIFQEPIYFLSRDQAFRLPSGALLYEQTISRYIVRQVFGTGIYPLNRFTRVEAGARLNNIDRTAMYISAVVIGNFSEGFVVDSLKNQSSLNYVQPYVAWVSDNALHGYTGPLMGRRYRFEVQPTLGTFRWMEYLADYRRYQPIIFNFLTVAVRGMTSLSIGPDEEVFPKYIGNPAFVRGYDRESVFDRGCGGLLGSAGCNASDLLGSRVALVNAELRFPLVRRFELGVLPIALPPLDGLFFYDAGVAWSRGTRLALDRERYGDDPNYRVPKTSYGAGLRLNLFGFAIIRWDYAIPLSRPGSHGIRDGFWSWSIGPSF